MPSNSGDTDSLTLHGTNPDGNPGTSGRETFAANFAAAGGPGQPRS